MNKYVHICVYIYIYLKKAPWRGSGRGSSFTGDPGGGEEKGLWKGAALFIGAL